MTLKGASLEYEGAPVADRWPINDGLASLASRWGIDPARDLTRAGGSPSMAEAAGRSS
jgi:hypothetical protein